MDTTKELLKKSAAEAVDILSKRYAEKQAQMTKSAENEALRQAILGGAIGGGAAGLGSLGYNYLRGKKMSLKDTLYAALAGAVPGAALGGMLPNDTIGKLPFDVTFGIDPFSKAPPQQVPGAGGQINSPPIPRGEQEVPADPPKGWWDKTKEVVADGAVDVGLIGGGATTGAVLGNAAGNKLTSNFKELPIYTPSKSTAEALKELGAARAANNNGVPGPGYDRRKGELHAKQEAAIKENIARENAATTKPRMAQRGFGNRVTKGFVKAPFVGGGLAAGSYLVPLGGHAAGKGVSDLAAAIDKLNKWLAPPPTPANPPIKP